MKVTANVINDLIVLQNAGEASADSLALIEEYARQHPEYVMHVKSTDEGTNTMLKDTFSRSSIDTPPDHEKRTLLRARQLIRARSYVLAMAVWFTAVPFAITVENFAERGLSFRNILGSNPLMMGLFGFLAAIGWVLFVTSNRRLSTLTGRDD